MYAKLKDNYINLDLIKRVTDVKSFHGYKRDYEDGDYQYLSPIINDTEEARLLALTTNGTPDQQGYVVAYGFYIYYIGQEKREKIIVGTNRREASKYLQSFMTLINNNVTSVKEVKI
jgi:hypothetical protein